MNKILCLAALVFTTVVMNGHAQHRLEVMVTGIRDTTGTVMIGLFTDAKSFLKNPVMGVKTKAMTGQIIAVFENLPAGECAISIIHDANRNGKLDKNFFGIPKEGFGFSNDAMGTFGPPSFEIAKFKVKSTMQIKISTRYL